MAKFQKVFFANSAMKKMNTGYWIPTAKTEWGCQNSQHWFSR